MILTFPYNEEQYVDNVYKLPGAGYGQNEPFICQVYSRKEIDQWMQENKGRMVDQEYYEVFTGDHWTLENKSIHHVRFLSKKSTI